jgi:hypothetical protein
MQPRVAIVLLLASIDISRQTPNVADILCSTQRQAHPHTVLAYSRLSVEAFFCRACGLTACVPLAVAMDIGWVLAMDDVSMTWPGGHNDCKPDTLLLR